MGSYLGLGHDVYMMIVTTYLTNHDWHMLRVAQGTAQLDEISLNWAILYGYANQAAYIHARIKHVGCSAALTAVTIQQQEVLVNIVRQGQCVCCDNMHTLLRLAIEKRLSSIVKCLISIGHVFPIFVSLYAIS